jgi:hypothetical protein
MKRAAIPLFLSLLIPAVLASVPPRAAAQQPQAMCRETLEAWARDKSLNAKWNSDRTAVIMVRGGVEYICTCPDQNKPPLVRQVKPASSPGARPAAPARPASPAPRPASPGPSFDAAAFERGKQELLRELRASGALEPVPDDGTAALLDGLGDRPPAVRAGVAAAARELAAGAPATRSEIRRTIEASVEDRSGDAAAIDRAFKVKAGAVPPLRKRFDDLKVGDVLLCRQPDDMQSLGFYTSGWIILADKIATGSPRARASHVFMLAREVGGVKLFLDNMPGQGTLIKTEARIEAEYADVGLDVARPLSPFDADLLWAAAKRYGIRSWKEFAARTGRLVDTTDYGVWGEGEMVCSETMRWALVRAGALIPETSSWIKKNLGSVEYGPADFYEDTRHFLVVPLERLPRRSGR